jgi:nitrate reductase NapE component
MLLFAAANPILGIFQKRWPRYVLFSFIAFGVTLTLTLFLAQATAGSPLRDLTQFQMFFVAACVFFLASTGLVGLYRFILRLLQDA